MVSLSGFMLVVLALEDSWRKWWCEAAVSVTGGRLPVIEAFVVPPGGSDQGVPRGNLSGRSAVDEGSSTQRQGCGCVEALAIMVRLGFGLLVFLVEKPDHLH